MNKKIALVEVGPRDGLQNDPTLLTTDIKLEFIERLIEAGIKRMEVASFVNPKLVPAMADSDAIMARLTRPAGVKFIGLALNERGMRRAIEAKCDEINYVMVAGAGFGRANQNATPDETAALFERIAILAHDAAIPVSVTISVAFGDPFDGEVPIGRVVALAARAARAGACEIALGDTIGVADPWDVRKRLDAVQEVIGDVPLRVHFHNTRNTALANIHAAIESGVSIIDASCGGIGGCPFAPAATGNVPTEDVVYMLERGGFDTGIDLSKLIKTSHWLEQALGHDIPGLVAKAGPFPA